MGKVSKDSFEKFRSGPDPLLEHMRHWVGCVLYKEIPIASCILIHPRIVITPLHAVANFVFTPTLRNISFEFDNFKGGAEDRTINIVEVRLDPDDPIVCYASSSAFDLGKTLSSPTDTQLDYVAFALESDFGSLPVNGVERGWLSVKDSFSPAPGSAAMLMAYPDGLRLAESNGRFENAIVDNRIHHTCNSRKGSSGGLLVSQGTHPLPAAMHIGGNLPTAEGAFNFGVPLSHIIDHIELTTSKSIEIPVDPPLSRLKVAVVAGLPDAETPVHKTVADFFGDSSVNDAFKARGFRPWIRDHDASIADLKGVVDVSNKSLSLQMLHSIARNDIALVIIGKKDGENVQIRDKLLTAYGFLSARLGTRRVHLIHHHEVTLNQCHVFETDEFSHSYSQKINEIAERASVIADVTRGAKEDSVQGLFEVGQVALPDYPDYELFVDPDFKAEHTLHILGFRFGRLKDELEDLFDTIRNKNSKVIVAFPGYEVSNRNPYLRNLLQSGGDETLEFLLETQKLIESKRYPDEMLSRVRYFALEDIPTFVLTAADLDYTEGRMLIAPAFPRGLNERKRGRPRWLVHNKLSNRGIYDAYRRVLTDFLENEDGRKDSWTLDETANLSAYIDKMKSEGTRLL